MRAVFDSLAAMLRRPNETRTDLLRYLSARTHQLGAYRGRSSGFDEETRAVAALHFQQLGIPSHPDQVLVSCGGAKGVFIAICAALMCRRDFDRLDRRGGTLLAPAGYYQSLRLIPAIFGGDIDVVADLDSTQVAAWLAGTAHRSGSAIYTPLVKNATGQVLTADQARQLGATILDHNTHNRANPVVVIGDDVYAGSYLDPRILAQPIGAVPGMSDWTISVVSPSKTFALPTSRIAFATTTHRGLTAALRHHQIVFSHGRAPQATELTAAAALALTPTAWIHAWNERYRDRFTTLATSIEQINTDASETIIELTPPQGGWYLELRLARTLFPNPITSNLDAFAILLHYGGTRTDTGIGLLPGELFGQRLTPTHRHVTLRATLAATNPDLAAFTTRLQDAITILRGPDGPALAHQALRRARAVADIDTILTHTHY